MTETSDVPGTGERVLLAGLGNPGRSYAGNRHNIGFDVLDEVGSRVGGRFKRHKAGADVIEGRFAGCPIVLAKPRSYMNVSGGAVSALARFFGMDAGGVVIVHDELDLDLGAVRLKFGGGEGGHNGLRSITKSLGTPGYYRVRFGVGRPPGNMAPADYVLKDFSAAQRRELGVYIASCADAIETLLSKGLSAAQTTFHAR